MFININILAILILSSVVLSLVSLMLILYCLKLYRTLIHLKRQESLLDNKLHQQTDQVLGQAFEQADTLIEDAQKASVSAGLGLSKQLQDGMQHILEEISSQVKGYVETSMKEFSTQLRTDYQVTKEQLESQMAKKREQEMMELDQKISQSVEKLSREILGKSISLSDHEQLVQEALEKAKKGIFS